MRRRLFARSLVVTAFLMVTLSITAIRPAWSFAIRPVVPNVIWRDIVFDYAGNMYGTDGYIVYRSLVSVDTAGGAVTFGAPTVYSNLFGLADGIVWGLAFDRATGDLYVSSMEGSVFKIPSGSTTASLFSNPGGSLQGMTIVGGDLYVADSYDSIYGYIGNRIVKINLSNGSFSTFVHVFNYQFRGLTTDGASLFATVYNAIYDKGFVVEIPLPSGTPVTILPGSGSMHYPEGIDIDELGNLFVADPGSSVVWMLPWYGSMGYGSKFNYGDIMIAPLGIRVNYFLYVSAGFFYDWLTGVVWQIDLIDRSNAVRFADIEDKINLYNAIGWIDNSGITNALLTKLNDAETTYHWWDTGLAQNHLTALKNQLSAPGIVDHITPAARDILLAEVQNLINRLGAPPDPIIGYVKDTNGTGVSNVYVTLYDSYGHIIAQAITDVAGFYYFADTSAMTIGEPYTIKATNWPSEYNYSTANPQEGQSFTWLGATVTSIADITLQ